jgi:RNA polymerase sigma-70 factor (ECF subfamily)
MLALLAGESAPAPEARMSENESTLVQRHLDRLQAGDLAARDELVARAYGKLQEQVARMLGQYPGVRRWEEADDVTNNAASRLWRALEEARPATALHFYHLAAVQVRRELIDLARRYAGPEGIAANHESVAPGDDSHRVADPSDHSHDPAQLALWAEFHRQVNQLPDEEREAFDLLYYQELPQAEAAALLGISEATLRRRWLAARLHLQDVLEGNLPG